MEDQLSRMLSVVVFDSYRLFEETSTVSVIRVILACCCARREQFSSMSVIVEWPYVFYLGHTV